MRGCYSVCHASLEPSPPHTCNNLSAHWPWAPKCGAQLPRSRLCPRYLEGGHGNLNSYYLPSTHSSLSAGNGWFCQKWPTRVPWWPSGFRISIVTAVAQVSSVAQVQSLAWELPHATGGAKKKWSDRNFHLVTLICAGTACSRGHRGPGFHLPYPCRTSLSQTHFTDENLSPQVVCWPSGVSALGLSP